jgi:hypothetical protein
MAKLIALMAAIDLRTERRRATWWSSANVAFFVTSMRLRFWPWLQRSAERLGRACLRRSVYLHWRRTTRLCAAAQREMRERGLPPVLRPSESRRPQTRRGRIVCPWGSPRVSE